MGDIGHGMVSAAQWFGPNAVDGFIAEPGSRVTPSALALAPHRPCCTSQEMWNIGKAPLLAATSAEIFDIHKNCATVETRTSNSLIAPSSSMPHRKRQSPDLQEQ